MSIPRLMVPNELMGRLSNGSGAFCYADLTDTGVLELGCSTATGEWSYEKLYI
jgi:hypothetical protein